MELEGLPRPRWWKEPLRKVRQAICRAGYMADEVGLCGGTQPPECLAIDGEFTLIACMAIFLFRLKGGAMQVAVDG